ncbi:type II secretion system protein [bacterium]|nr:type II secretion system protein [bacterium]
MTKRFGFTLAEVLITLGIIGVVAAMTIPTLIANTNSAKFRSQYKKALSTLNQAALMGQAQYDMNYGDATAVCNATEATAAAETATSDATICAILNDVLSGAEYVGDVTALRDGKGNAYAVTAATTGTSGFGTAAAGVTQATVATGTHHAYKLADGSMFAFEAGTKDCIKSTPCLGFIDVNGVTLPNKEVSIKGGDGNDKDSVPNDAAHMTDVYPVRFYDSTVEPLTAAARYVLTTSK